MTGEGRPRSRSRLSARWSRAWRRRTLVVALVTAAAVGIGGWSLAAVQTRAVDQQQRAEDAEEEALVARDNAVAIAEGVRAACAQEDETAELLGDLCGHADEVVEEPAEPALVGPTEEQLRPLVREYVHEWLAQNTPRYGRDGRTPTVDEITAIVTPIVVAEVARNQPEDGRTPTPEEITAIAAPIVAQEVDAWLSANPPPPGEPGQDGSDGAPGQDGAAGADGRDGVDGEDGQPPAGWTQPCGSLLDPDRRCVCTRDPESPDEAPAYSCEPVP